MVSLPYYKAPSSARLAQALKLTPAQCKLVRALLHGQVAPYDREARPRTAEWIDRCYNEPYHSLALTAALDEVCGTFGVHPVNADQSTWCNGWPVPYIEYLSMGGTYDATLIINHDQRRAYINSWGNEIERLELNKERE